MTYSNKNLFRDIFFLHRQYFLSEVNFFPQMDFDYSVISFVQILTFFNIYSTESLLKMMKNAFYFIFKALFLLEIFKLLSQLFDCKLYQTLDYRSKDMLNFNLSIKVLGLVSPPHFAYDFSRKIFLMQYFIIFLMMESLLNFARILRH